MPELLHILKHLPNVVKANQMLLGLDLHCNHDTLSVVLAGIDPKQSPYLLQDGTEAFYFIVREVNSIPPVADEVSKVVFFFVDLGIDHFWKGWLQRSEFPASQTTPLYVYVTALDGVDKSI